MKEFRMDFNKTYKQCKHKNKETTLISLHEQLFEQNYCRSCGKKISKMEVNK